ncbi:MAG: putative lipid II flippase FtsW [Deltaproteobacteria bacterium]|nr:putative lipid II flippase FtsW [Deltaproteobacteria bacterium]
MELRRNFDISVLLLAVVLSCLGVIMVYSASAVVAGERFADGFHFLKRQGLFLAVGFILMGIAMFFDYRHLRKTAIPMLILSLGLLVLILFPGMGREVNGAVRWFRLGGISFQPSELAKLALVIYMAHSLTKKKQKIKSFRMGFLPYMLVMATMLLLILMEPDLGSGMVLAAVGLLIMIIAGVKLRYLFSVVIMMVPFLYFAIMNVPYRRERILAFLNPWKAPDSYGYQIIQSQIAFEAGGLWGQGLGEGKQKLFYLPEAHTDFVFSVVGEELGFIGVLVVISMFLLLIIQGFRIALNTEDPFGRYLAFGLTVLLGLEAFLNVAVVLGLLPPKGMALPFLSYGGSNLVCSLVAVGILLSISSRNAEAAK